MVDINVSCSCGALKGVLRDASAKNGTRMTCYCRDCQAFAEFLGKSEAVLDAQGGTDIYQTTPSRFDIVDGADRLACVGVTDKGTLRWYASCCNTPIGNTAKSRALPFVGFVTLGFADTSEASIGPSRGAVFAGGARGTAPAGARVNIPGLAVKVLGRTLKAKLTGAEKHNPFFADDGAPVSALRTLTTEERADIDGRLDARFPGETS